MLMGRMLTVQAEFRLRKDQAKLPLSRGLILYVSLEGGREQTLDPELLAKSS